MAHAEVEERQLLKAMTWWDGFVVALANPGFLIAALGASIGALGTTGAFVLWTISICLGALQNNVHAELAAMFPNKSGGIALYAHEAWRKYLTIIGPLATFGYWIGWSVVLSINGLVAGTLIQAEWFEDTTWAESAGTFDFSLPIVIGIGLIILVWAFNVFGVRPAVWFGYITGALLIIPAVVLMFMPYLTGDWSSDNMTWDIGANGGLALALVWLYFMCWSSYGIEVVATFAPEYQDTERDTARALRAAALFSSLVYVLLPLGVGGTLGTATIAEDATLISFYTQAFDVLVGNALGNVMIFCIVAALILSMNTATMDGSRALYGISRDGMTIREFGVLNRHHVPGRAMTLDAILNIFLITAFAGVLEILAVSNVGYVFATCAALSGFLLLRKDRPQWPRPVRLPNYWVPIAGVLFLINFTFLVVGGFLYSGGFLGIEGYGYGWDKTRTGLLVLLAAVLLYIWRHVVQDKLPMKLREQIPRTPEEERAHAELKAAPTAASI
jgi:amino acid transporter